jgi:hypothetical protein
MVKDMMEYSTKNPAIDPLLKSYGIVVNRSTAAK